MGYTVVVIIFLLSQCDDRLETSESDVHKRQILMSKVSPNGIIKDNRCYSCLNGLIIIRLVMVLHLKAFSFNKID